MSRDFTLDWLDRAIALCELGRLEDADEALQEALREDPNDPFTHGIRALVLMDLDRPEEALEAASISIGLAPDLQVGHMARARAFLSLERFDEAEASAKEAIRLAAEDADARVLLAFCFLGRGRWAEALAAAEDALRLEPESESAQGVRALALGMSQGGDDWRQAAAETLAIAPGSSLAHAFAGQAHLVRGGEREAAERFREALRLDPESEFAQAGLAEAMKASHPLFKPLFRFFMWQERLSNGWKAALIVGPLIGLRALRPFADNPIALTLIVLWIAFWALTWLGVPVANVALRFSPVGRAVLPAEQRRSSEAFLAFLGAAVLALVLGLVVSASFAVGLLPLVLLAFVVGNAHELRGRSRRIVYASAIAAGVAAFTAGALAAAGAETAGLVLFGGSIVTGIVLIWVVRLG